jgi:uncharacterized membrane protein YhaH (DUF805 family)
MRIKLGIVGLLVVLFLVLGMTRLPSTEGYVVNSSASSSDVAIWIFIVFFIILIAIFLPGLFPFLTMIR